MIMPNAQLKLIDFGIARTYKEGKRRDTMSMGTAAYAPFEQFGKGQTDARSDVYSLAATLYHLLTGRPPTPATTPTSLRDFNPRLSQKTEQLIIRAMSRDMDVRPQTAIIMETELRSCLGKPYTPPVLDERLTQPASQGGSSTPIRPLPATPSTPSPVAVQGPAHGVAVANGIAGNGSASAPKAPVPSHAQIPIAPISDPNSAPSEQPTEHTCMVCGAKNQLKAHFCGRCGASLAGRPAGKIQVLGPNGVLWERRILENPFNIGRRSLSRQIFPHLDLTYNDPAAYVSRQHARILADAGGYFVEDLGSANGTFLNDRRLPGGVPTRLRNGDRVRIGKVQCTFTLGG
jgi:serine/threonine protein kinase